MKPNFKEIDIQTKGPTDSGYPLHVVLYSKNRKFDLAKLKAQGKAIFFINNGIHPGEPDGIGCCSGQPYHYHSALG